MFFKFSAKNAGVSLAVEWLLLGNFSFLALPRELPLSLFLFQLIDSLCAPRVESRNRMGSDWVRIVEFGVITRAIKLEPLAWCKY